MASMLLREPRTGTSTHKAANNSILSIHPLISRGLKYDSHLYPPTASTSPYVGTRNLGTIRYIHTLSNGLVTGSL